jgi:tetratricopeptide (TPR) repeat protein
MSARDPRRTDAAPIEDRILDMLHGLLTDAEASRLVAEIRGDPARERLLFESARALERARALGAPSPLVAPRRLGQRIRVWVGKPRVWTVALGAAAMLTVGVLSWPDRSVPSYVRLPAGGEELHLRSQGGISPELRDGIAAYADADWERAIELLRDAPADQASDTLRRIYLASAYALTSRPAEALRELDDVRVELVPEPWGGEARWTRAMALRDVGRAEEAREALRAIADEPGALGDRARRVLAR